MDEQRQEGGTLTCAAGDAAVQNKTDPFYRLDESQRRELAKRWLAVARGDAVTQSKREEQPRG